MHIDFYMPPAVESIAERQAVEGMIEAKGKKLNELVSARNVTYFSNVGIQVSLIPVAVATEPVVQDSFHCPSHNSPPLRKYRQARRPWI
jgi:hypothetical protein